jgi:hypothetical protein
MPSFRYCLPWAAGSLLIGSVIMGQTAAPRAPTAPGVTRAVEHPSTPPDATEDTSKPATAADPQTNVPETAQDDQKTAPETATDKPRASSTQKAAEVAKQGVRSNTPPLDK